MNLEEMGEAWQRALARCTRGRPPPRHSTFRGAPILERRRNCFPDIDFAPPAMSVRTRRTGSTCITTMQPCAVTIHSRDVILSAAAVVILSAAAVVILSAAAVVIL